MRKSGKLLLILGILLAVSGGGALFMFLQSLSGAAAKAPVPVNIVVAGADIPSYKPITAEMLRLIPVAPDTVTQDNVRQLPTVVGKALKTPAKSGQQILTTNLTESSFSYSIEKGKRAQAVWVDRLSVFNGLLKEGDRVDVIFMGTYPQINGSEGMDEENSTPQDTGPTGKMVVQNAQVLKIMNPKESNAAGSLIVPEDLEIEEPEGEGEAKGLWTVVLGVTDQEAEYIRYSQTFGIASLVMRAQGDGVVGETTGVSEEILNDSIAVPIPVQPKK